MVQAARQLQPSAIDELLRYKLLVSSIVDYAIFMLDTTGRVVSWNAGAERFKGYRPEEIIGHHFSKFYTPEDQAAGVPDLALAMALREGKFETEGWRVRKGGSRFWAHVVIDPIRSPNGELTGYAKITRDLTERRETLEILRRSEEQFRILIQGVSDYAIYMLDPDGIITNWNLGAERIKGYSSAEIIGKHFSQFYTEEDRTAGLPKHALETALKEGRYEKEGWRVRKDGSRFWAHIIIDPIRSPEGSLRGFAKITRDITERKKAQEALELSRQAMMQTQKTEAIGQLTGGVAHDFNNLLMAILGSLALVKKRIPRNPSADKLLDNAILAAQRGASLIQRMLAFARKQDMKVGPVSLPGVISGIKELVEATIGSSATIETRIATNLPAVEADANQLELAIVNLCVNARDAMPDGGSITIVADEIALADGNPLNLPPGAYVRLAVSDTGVGMDSTTLAKATEPFFTTKEVGKGTGLGLSMVHGMAEQLGGRLSLISRKGEGTRVEIWLKAAQGEGVYPEGVDTAPDEASSRKLRILAVDDDNLVLFNTVEMLRDLGHAVTEASSGQAALEALRTSPMDLVITDQVMPRMTGMELIEALGRSHPSLPTILATGFAEAPKTLDPNIPKLRKPFTQRDLTRAIEQVISHASAQ